MSLHLQYLKHLQCRQLCTVLCVSKMTSVWMGCTYQMCTSMLGWCYRRNEGRGLWTHSGLVIQDCMTSDRHNKPGCDLTALFTVMRSSLNYVTIGRFCLSSFKHSWAPAATTPSPVISFSVLIIHTETPANTNCTMFSAESQMQEAKGLTHTLFFLNYYKPTWLCTLEQIQ